MAAATIPQSFLSLSKTKPSSLFKPQPAGGKILSRPNLKKQSLQLVNSAENDFDVLPVQSSDSVDQQDGVVFLERESEPTEVDQVIGGFGGERLSFDGAAGILSSASGVGGMDSGDGKSEEEMERLIDRAINAAIVLAAGSFAITKLLTIDHDYWHVSLEC